LLKKVQNHREIVKTVEERTQGDDDDDSHAGTEEPNSLSKTSEKVIYVQGKR